MPIDRLTKNERGLFRFLEISVRIPAEIKRQLNVISNELAYIGINPFELAKLPSRRCQDRERSRIKLSPKGWNIREPGAVPHLTRLLGRTGKERENCENDGESVHGRIKSQH